MGQIKGMFKGEILIVYAAAFSDFFIYQFMTILKLTFFRSSRKSSPHSMMILLFLLVIQLMVILREFLELSISDIIFKSIITVELLKYLSSQSKVKESKSVLRNFPSHSIIS